MLKHSKNHLKYDCGIIAKNKIKKSGWLLICHNESASEQSRNEREIDETCKGGELNKDFFILNFT